MDKSRLTGTLPPSIGQWTDLLVFLVDDNLFSGELPSSIAAWRPLQVFSIGIDKDSLDVTDRVLSGPIPEANWTDLTMFGAYNHRFSGSLPQSLGQLTNIQMFNVAVRRNICGLVASLLYQSLTLVFPIFCLQNNSLTGTLPDSIVNWSAVEIVSVRDNHLSGTIPNISEWPLLTDARFQNNNFTGTIEEGVCASPTLSSLWADCIDEVTCSCCDECF